MKNKVLLLSSLLCAQFILPGFAGAVSLRQLGSCKTEIPMQFDSSTTTKSLHVSKSGHSGASGTSSDPFLYIQDAVNAASPGTRVMVHQGWYRENVTVKNSGLPGAPIVIQSADGFRKAAIDPGLSITGVVRGFGVSYIVIEGFEIRDTYGDAVIFTMKDGNFQNPVHHIVITNNYIADSRGDGIKIAQGHNIYVYNNFIEDVSQEEGIDFVAVDDSIIAYNSIRDIRGGSGIMVKGGSTNVIIEGNLIEYIGRAGNGINMGMFTDIEYIKPGAGNYEGINLVARNNLIANTKKRAIQFVACKDCSATYNTLVSTKYYQAMHIANHSRNSWKNKNILISGNYIIKDDNVTRSVIGEDSEQRGNFRQKGNFSINYNVDVYTNGSVSTRKLGSYLSNSQFLSFDTNSADLRGRLPRGDFFGDCRSGLKIGAFQSTR